MIASKCEISLCSARNICIIPNLLFDTSSSRVTDRSISQLLHSAAAIQAVAAGRSKGNIFVPKYVFVMLGMLSSAIGGVLGAWLAFKCLYIPQDQPAEIEGNLIAYGGIFAALIGGLVSLRGGRTQGHGGRLGGILALAVGLGISCAISPVATLMALFPLSLIMLIGVWPFALLGGCMMYVLLLVSVRLAESRMKQRPAST